MANENLLARLRRSVQAFKAAPNIELAAAQLARMMEDDDKPSDIIAEKALGSTQKSKLDVRTTDNNLAYVAAYNVLSRFVAKQGKIPPRGDTSRDVYLADFWQDEPILAGAVYSMTAKMTALRWYVTGRRLQARRAATLLAGAAHMDGYDWGGFIASTAQDFFSTNRGVFWESPRIGEPIVGNLSGLGHIDSLCCSLTGNKKIPMIYASEVTGQVVNFKQGEYIHFTSLPSPRERNIGHGFCAVDRAYRAAKLLISVHDYDEEKLSNLPPEGVATVTGLTMQEFMDALELWKAARRNDRSLTFPQVLWLIGSQPNTDIKVTLQGFSQLPESFNREQVVTHYVSTLAMDFGVDAREFWPISSGALGTASESEIQHLKAKGKGHGEFISITERHINAELDEETQFRYDTQDIEEDMNAALVAKAWVDAFYPLYTGTPAGKSKASPGGKPNTEMVPNPEEIEQSSASGQAMSNAGPALPPGMGGPGSPEQVITKDELKRLLADAGVLPEWMLSDARYRVDDTTIHISHKGELYEEDFTQFSWQNGVLKEERLPGITLTSQRYDYGVDVGVAGGDEAAYALWDNENKELVAVTWLKQREDEIKALQRNIVGSPIPDNEAKRGARVTRNTVQQELERWRKDPALAQYVPTEDELKAIIEAM